MKRTRQYGVFLAAAVWLCLAVLSWVYPARAESLTERRALAQKPGLTLGSVLDGSFNLASKADFATANIYNKPAWHGELNAQNPSHAGRNMNQIGG